MAKNKVKKEVDIAVEIKKMEDAKRKKTPIKLDSKMSFNSWYHQHKHRIPKQHLKEILWADFIARGVKEQSTVEEFNKALTLYGVKLKVLSE